jgi:purine-nucleoside phosphorylase
METAHDLYDRAADAASRIKDRVGEVPATAVITGSGLGAVASLVHDPVRLPYASIPNFPQPMTAGHEGAMLVGEGPGGRPLAVLSGRSHLYEGYTVKSVTFPIRALQLLGVRTLILTNAAGGIDESFAPGDLMAITDQINLTGEDPLIGENDPRLGMRFVDMSQPFDPIVLALAAEVVGDLDITLRLGTYAGVVGPAFETRAEIERLRRAGAAAVGMSTVNEVIAARHAQMRVFAVSVITNVAGSEMGQPSEEVLEASRAAVGRLSELLAAIISRLPAESGAPSAV